MDDLQVIKWLLVAILAGMFLITASVLFMTYVFWWGAGQVSEQRSGEVFRSLAEDFLAKGETELLVEHSQERLNGFPHDVWAHWYMGHARYLRGELDEAQRSFARVLELRPSWEGSVSGWLEKIGARGAEGTHRVQ